jgi:tRNA (adenine22-N1)-methyltransferase
MNKIVLSKRLEAVAHMVAMRHKVCDVGCDHAPVAIYLVEQGISPRAIAMDINNGPLERARANVAASQFPDRIELRLSDGLAGLRPGEAESLLIAGMGGPLMQTIMQAEPKKTESFEEMILQPQSEIPAFRRFLRLNGFVVVAEDMVLDNSKFYPIMKAIPKKKLIKADKNVEDAEESLKQFYPPEKFEKAAAVPEGGQEGKSTRDAQYITIGDCYGYQLLRQRHPVLLAFLRQELRVTRGIINSINNNSRYENNENYLKLGELYKKADELSDLIGLW